MVVGAGLSAAATRHANLLLGLIVAVAALVVSARRPQAQWAGLPVFVRLALLVIVIRVGFAVLFGVRVGTTDLFTLPSITLPEWMAGVHSAEPSLRRCWSSPSSRALSWPRC